MKKNHTHGYAFLCALLLLPFLTMAQSGSISGRVSDEKNEPFIGASVAIKALGKGTVTDLNGNYQLSGLPGGEATVTVSFIGYQTLERNVTINGNTRLDIQLSPSSQGLNEVVVIGYGTQRKTDLTGSVVTVTAKDFNKGQNTSPEQLIAGKVAGVSITTNGGAPGSGSTIRIRGGASLSANNNPLIVIDGVALEGGSIAGSANPLSLINPDDIESINILKDASATAIYGSRASNGVIIITTKKGSGNQAFAVNFNSVNSVSNNTRTVDVLSADQLRKVVETEGTPAQAALLGNANTNWQNEIYRSGVITDNTISFSGGVKNLPYRFSLGYLNQDGTLKTSDFQRTTAGLNLTKDLLNQSLKVNLNLKGAYTKSRFANEGAIGSAVNFDPTQPIYSGNENFGGYYEWLDANGNPNTLATRNPLGLLMDNHNNGNSRRSFGNVQLNYTLPFLKDLKVNANVGYDVSEGYGTTFIPAYAAATFAQKGSSSKYYQSNLNYLTDYYLNYVKEVGSINSRFDFTTGYSYQYFKTYNRGAQTYAADNVTTIGQPTLPSKPHYYIESFFGRLNYALNDKYLLTATIRNDVASRFSKENRSGLFPSVALAWRVNKESYMQNVKGLSDFKLRAGYGVTGQQDIGSNFFPYLPRYIFSDNAAQYQFGNEFVNTLRAEAYDTNIKWEETRTSNIGLDYGFLDGRITGTLDYYYKETQDLLSYIPLAAGSNLTNYITTNVGDLHSKGIEFAINANPIKKKDLNWNIGFNISTNEVKIDNLSKTNDPNQVVPTGGIGGGVGNTIQQHRRGYTPNSFYVYKQVYDQSGTPIEKVYADLNNDGMQTEQDMYLYQSPQPKVIMGFNSSVGYKKFDLSFSMRANLGNYVYNNVAAATGAYAGFKFPNYIGNLSSSVLQTDFSSYQLFSDYYIQNASFLRMDNINLSYDAGRLFKSGYNLRLSAAVSNAFVITKYNGLDPEVFSGIDNNFYPRPRVFSLGLNIGL